MTIDIELAINLMQTQHATLVTSFPTLLAPQLSAYPTALDTANLPCLLTWPGPGRWGQKGNGYKTDERTMYVMGFVDPLNQSDIPNRATLAVQLLQATRNLWITASKIPLAAPDANSGYQIAMESSDALRHSDQGIGPNLTMAGKTYHGFILSVQIRILWSVQ